MPAKKAAKTMTKQHKEALAKGREQGRVVRAYLAALNEAAKPGRKVSRDELEKRLVTAREQIDTEPDPAKRVELIQRRLDLEARLSEAQDETDTSRLEADFIGAAREYGERKGITYSAWREAGVPAGVLKQAGIPRTRRTAA